MTLLNLALRNTLPGYPAAERTLQFTAAMKTGRLTEAALTSIFAGAATRLIAPRSRLAPLAVGLILLVAFLPVHLQIWNKLPVWYHLTFLLTLVPLVLVGAWIPLAPRGARSPAAL